MSQPTSAEDLTQVAQNLRRLEDNGADIREPRSPYLMYLDRKVEQEMRGWMLWVTHYFAPKVKCAAVLSKEVNNFKDLKFNRDWNGECWSLSDGIHWVPRISPTNPLTNPCACYIHLYNSFEAAPFPCYQSVFKPWFKIDFTDRVTNIIQYHWSGTLSLGSVEVLCCAFRRMNLNRTSVLSLTLRNMVRETYSQGCRF